ncbi:hypothetical protein LQZ19_06000 [Treponema primitia]|uniref:hypothetical protein n=1 Tax=Treponema primitia TaxID=88058 RepID=UPI00397FFC0F
MNIDDTFSYSQDKLYFKIDDVYYYESINTFINYQMNRIGNIINGIISIPIYKDIDEDKSEIISILDSSDFMNHTMVNISKSTQEERNKTIYSYKNLDKYKDMIKLYTKLSKNKNISTSFLLNEKEKTDYSVIISLCKERKGMTYLNGIKVGKIS